MITVNQCECHFDLYCLFQISGGTIIDSERTECLTCLRMSFIKLSYTCSNYKYKIGLFCSSASGSSWLESLFTDWAEEGMVVRLDIRHWLHRWDTVVIKQSHAKYGIFISALAGAILAYNKEDIMKLVKAIRKGDEKLYSKYTDEKMLSFIKHHQLKCYVRRVTRGVQVSRISGLILYKKLYIFTDI